MEPSLEFLPLGLEVQLELEQRKLEPGLELLPGLELPLEVLLCRMEVWLDPTRLEL